MVRGDINGAWDTFWERERRKGNAPTGSRNTGCMPESWNRIVHVQAQAWRGFAKRLPKGARVLDLGTGDGSVLVQLLQSRRDLKPLGIDRAPAIPTPPRGVKFRGGVMMEALPLPGNHFAAVTSQFGFEYGDVLRVVAEIARVTSPEGAVALMTHRLDGPIVAHNLERREQIAWALDEQKLLELARNSLALRRTGIAALPRQVIEAPEKGAALHGRDSAAWEIAEAIRRTLHLGRRDDPAQVAAILNEIGEQARNELGRIASLLSAAEAVSDGGKIVAMMADAGLTCVDHTELDDAVSATPFADFRIFRRAR